MITFSQLGNYGRLGNQMFQIATMIGYAKKHNINWAVPQDWEYLNAFYKTFPTHPPHRGSEYKHYIEPRFEYTEIPHCDNIDIAGYFQSEKYFEHCKEEVLKQFTMKADYAPWGCLRDIKDFRIAIHIRRGDYLKTPDFYCQLTPEYYKEGINIIIKRKCLIRSIPDIHVKIICFSDDIEWCKQELPKYFKVDYFLEGYTPTEDLFLMSGCDAFVIANSSFSWWGAYLSEQGNINKGTTIVAPNNWFMPQTGLTTKDLIPERWIKL